MAVLSIRNRSRNRSPIGNAASWSKVARPQWTSLKLPGGHWHIHDLRRTGATLMQNCGVPPHVIEAVLNHTEPNRMKRIYQQHKYEKEMRDAWLLLGAYLDKLMKKKLPKDL